MKTITFAVLMVVAGFQVNVAHAANVDAKQQATQAVSASQVTHGAHSILDQPAQKRWDSWDFSSGHDADGVPVPRS